MYRPIHNVLPFLHAVPSTPATRLQGSAVNATAVQLSWQPVPSDELNGLLRSYTVTLQDLNGRTTYYNTSTANIVIGSLTPCNNYNWNVKPLTIAYGPVSSNSSVTTLPRVNGTSNCSFSHTNNFIVCGIVSLMISYRLYDETEGSTKFRTMRKLYRHPRAKRKGVYRFARGSKSRRPRGFHRLRYLYYNNLIGFT